MLKKVLVICDSELSYTHAFIDYMRSQKNISFEYIGFSTIEELTAFSKSNNPEIMIVSKSLLTDEIKQLKGRLLLLVDSANEVDDDSIYKYQKIVDIISEISLKCEENLVRNHGKNLLLGNSKMIGMYSPIKRTGKSIFSITLAAVLSGSYKVLYLNLETNCGFEWAFYDDDTEDLSDVMYAIRQDKTDKLDTLCRAIKNNGYFDFIVPVTAPEDIRTIEYSQLVKLFTLITSMNKYQVIVIDFDELLDEYLSLLSDCDRIYMPLIDDDISIIKLRKFFKVLDSRCMEFDKEKAIPLLLPKCDEDIVTTGGMERLLWSNFGIYVKEVLEEVEL